MTTFQGFRVTFQAMVYDLPSSLLIIKFKVRYVRNWTIETYKKWKKHWRFKSHLFNKTDTEWVTWRPIASTYLRCTDTWSQWSPLDTHRLHFQGHKIPGYHSHRKTHSLDHTFLACTLKNKQISLFFFRLSSNNTCTKAFNISKSH